MHSGNTMILHGHSVSSRPALNRKTRTAPAKHVSQYPEMVAPNYCPLDLEPKRSIVQELTEIKKRVAQVTVCT